MRSESLHPSNGKGTTPHGTPSSAPLRSDKTDGDPLRVLLVDDHASVLRFLSFAFSERNCSVASASTAEEALEHLERSTFDLVVSDIKMPGLSGLDLLQTTKAKHPELPVVLITGAPSVDSAIFGLRHRAYDYLAKPFTVDEVHQILQRVREDRQHSKAAHPLELTEELARRQAGVEGLSRLGQLALQRLEPSLFVDKVLDQTRQSLQADAAVIVLRDEEGDLTPTQKGDPQLTTHLVSLLTSAFQRLNGFGDQEALALDSQIATVAAVVPGKSKPAGVVCLGRATGVEFRDDEKEFLLGYARTIGLALENILLAENLEANLIDTISSFVVALESKDRYLKGHSARVSLYSGELASALGLSPGKVAMARRAGILHDLGKLVALDAILLKPDRLTTEEFALMKGHPLIAAKILRPLRFLAEEAEAIKRHHERFDGSGYPDGLKGDQIPLPARIITVADAFDAMTSTRPYRSALPIDAALAELERHAGAQFDPAVTQAFVSLPRAKLTEISHFYDNREPETPEPLSPGVVAGRRGVRT